MRCAGNENTKLALIHKMDKTMWYSGQAIFVRLQSAVVLLAIFCITTRRVCLILADLNKIKVIRQKIRYITWIICLFNII